MLKLFSPSLFHLLFKNWNVFEIVWLFSFIFIGCIITLVQQDTWFNFVVLLSGILCVVLAEKAIFSIIVLVYLIAVLMHGFAITTAFMAKWD